MTDSDGDTLSDLPPSAKLVYKVLEYKGPLTQKAIVEESMLSARTVRYALERLEEIDIVTEDVYFADARQNLYEIDGGAETVEEPTDAAVSDD
jgi:predicted transcriptional regulator